jgi:hypothetical protein
VCDSVEWAGLVGIQDVVFDRGRGGGIDDHSSCLSCDRDPGSGLRLDGGCCIHDHGSCLHLGQDHSIGLRDDREVINERDESVGLIRSERDTCEYIGQI